MTERQKELRRAQQRRYYARHKEKCRAMTHAWLAKNPDYRRQEAADRYMLDPETKKARSRDYYAANRERINTTRRKRQKDQNTTNTGTAANVANDTSDR